MTSLDQKEAVRLTWKSRHIPVGTILMVCLVVASIASAILTILAESPSNPIP
jgi:hypothetical protein